MKRPRSLMKWLIITVIALFVFSFIGRKLGWVGGKEKKDVTVESVQRRTVIEVVSASGRIQPEVQVKISPDVSGEIVELNVKEGDRVKKGQLLVRILPDIYQSYVDRSVATVNTTKANYENSRSRVSQAESQLVRARAAYDRNKQLFEEKLISPSEWELVKSTFEVAEAEVAAARQAVDAANFNVRSAEASLKEANDNLRKTSIFAPVDGTISKLNVEKGERVVGTSQMAGTEMMVLADLNEMEVNVDVNENDIVRVHMDDTATIEVDAYLGKKFTGIVTEVSNSANITGMSVDQVTNFTVKVRILRESYEKILAEKGENGTVFHPGMSATVDIRTSRVENVLSVPIQSVTTRDTAKTERKEGETVTVSTSTSMEASKEIECVFIVVDGKTELRPVTIGLQDNTYIEILSGVKEDEKVVTAPYSAISRSLKKDDQVNVVKKEELYAAEEN
ncbi:MAG: efflux RND transporter periplasmic adaptor subunit [Bacteroidota bacterium]